MDRDMPGLIGITGLAGSGKDTLAQAFVDNGYRLYSFALPLKRALNTMFGWRMEFWEDREWKEGVLPAIGVSPRYLAQTIGTEWGRKTVNPDLWVKLADFEYALDYQRPMVIPDVRFVNEARWIHEMGGFIMRVVRPGISRQFDHVSEDQLPSQWVHKTITNSASIEWLRQCGVDAAREWYFQNYDNR